MKSFVFLLVMMLIPLPVLAHKVIAGVFASGSSIEGEIGFSSGDMASNTEVVVTGPDGTELGKTITDADGFFVFTPTVAVDHTFFADLGAGHVASVTMLQADVAKIIGVAAPVAPVAPVASSAPNAAAPPNAASTTTLTVAALTQEERQAIAAAVRAEIRPLRREIAAYRERNDFQTILGGIGYIAGLFGLGFYLAARRKLAA